MAWSLWRSRRKDRRATRPRFVPRCETLEDRTVLDVAGFNADLLAAQANQLHLNTLVAQSQTSLQAALQAATVALNDATLEQRIAQETTQLAAQINNNTINQISSLGQQEQRSLSALMGQFQGLVQLFNNPAVARSQPLVQMVITALTQVQTGIVNLVTTTNAQANNLVAGNAAVQNFYQLVQAGASNSLHRDLTIPFAFGPTTGSGSSSSTSASSPLITLNVNPLDINLLGLEIQTNQIQVTVSA